MPWIGFTALSKSVNEAAASRSIRYQRERVRQWAKDEGRQVLHEEAFMETKADRGTRAILPEIDRLLARAEKLDATLALVNYAESFHWRHHVSLWRRLQAEDRVMPRDPVPVLIDGQFFDPSAHFRAWTDMAETHIVLKPHTKPEIAPTSAPIYAM